MTVGLKVRDAADGVLVNQNSGSTYLVNSSVLLEANYEIPIAKELLLLFLSEERFDILYTYETVDQLRTTPLLDLEQHPAVVPMRFASITPNADGLYAEQEFLNLLHDSIEEYDRIVETYALENAA